MSKAASGETMLYLSHTNTAHALQTCITRRMEQRISLGEVLFAESITLCENCMPKQRIANEDKHIYE